MIVNIRAFSRPKTAERNMLSVFNVGEFSYCLTQEKRVYLIYEHDRFYEMKIILHFKKRPQIRQDKENIDI